ncbi:hypothetical protein [Sessilibacter corallicola]|uniref:hypothetical protein n=1 Tax=Sessilibacter corallicola TaxID=2904075 RepID=UPI001E58BCCC|nr:hypothetical protein [Sessilibacter corallicola]MCE2028735.1 hypothetical protein [Sessilibacter corallicola]
MSNSSKKDKIKDVSEIEFSQKLKEYAKKIKKANKPLIPNEPIGHINTTKAID